MKIALKGIHIRAGFVSYKEYLARVSFAEHTHHLKAGHLHFTFTEARSLVRVPDLERFFRARDVSSKESSSVAEADADAVSVLLTPTEAADFV